MDSRPSDETLLLAVAEHDLGFRGDSDIAAWLWGIAIRRLVSRTGRNRNVAAHARDGVEHVEPSLDDAYLLLRGGLPEPETAREVAS